LAASRSPWVAFPAVPKRRPLARLAALLLVAAAGLGLVGCGHTAGDGRMSPPSTSPK
jgi:hypothetical protein